MDDIDVILKRKILKDDRIKLEIVKTVLIM